LLSEIFERAILRGETSSTPQSVLQAPSISAVQKVSHLFSFLFSNQRKVPFRMLASAFASYVCEIHVAHDEERNAF
jgi:hypothetical protein